MGTCEFTLDRYKTFFNHVVSCVRDYQLINRKFNPSKTVTSWCQTSRRDFRFFGAALSTARESETPWKRTPGLCCRTRWVHRRPRIQQSNPARRRGGHGRAHPMRASGRENRMWMQWYRYRDGEATVTPHLHPAASGGGLWTFCFTRCTFYPFRRNLTWQICDSYMILLR
jgi:hypothetical protein